MTPGERYRALAQALLDAEEVERGARARVARRLAVSPSYLTRILSGEREVGEQIMHRAIDGLGVPHYYFVDDELEHEDPLRYVGVLHKKRGTGEAPHAPRGGAYDWGRAAALADEIHEAITNRESYAEALQEAVQLWQRLAHVDEWLAARSAVDQLLEMGARGDGRARYMMELAPGFRRVAAEFANVLRFEAEEREFDPLEAVIERDELMQRNAERE